MDAKPSIHLIGIPRSGTLRGSIVGLVGATGLTSTSSTDSKSRLDAQDAYLISDIENRGTLTGASLVPLPKNRIRPHEKYAYPEAEKANRLPTPTL
jgi:hypothetical protein